MSAPDYVILGAYLLAITGIGVRAHRGQKNARDFLLAGKSMPWLPVGFSIVASFISGISYIGLPAEIRSHGLAFTIYALAYVLVIPIMLRTFLPFYAGRQITTAYEFLEGRFSSGVRKLASGMFIFWRLLWIATVIYVPSLVISTVAGVPLLPAVLVIGILTTAYTALGGIKAVIWTDFTQFFVMFGGALLAIGFIANAVPGGVGGIWEAAARGGRTRMLDLSLDPTVRITLWGALIGGFFANLSVFGVDQLVIQRYLTTRSADDLRRTYLLNCFALFLVVAVLSFLGLALFAFYDRHRALLPAAVPPDHVLPWFIAHQFPPGLTGLLVASILAATMSALSAGINAVTTALFNDFLKARRPPESSGSEDLRRARVLSLAVGLFSTALASMVGRLGTIMEIAVRLIDGFAGPLLGIFIVGIFNRTVGAPPILVAGLLGVVVTAFVNFFSPISFMWYSPIGCVTTLLAAFALPPFLGSPKENEKLAALPHAD
jgi:sodium-coupled monocarboxylate transporter 8/12